MNKIYYLGLSGERSLPFGLLVVNFEQLAPVCEGEGRGTLKR